MPEKYYLDYFNYVLDFVERQYDHILDEPEYLFYQDFRSLTEEAQCLYIRFSNRRGDFFRMSKISYTEILDLEAAKSELYHQGFISINESEDPLQFNLFTKSELLETFDFLDKGQRKVELLSELSEHDVLRIHEEEEIAQVLKNEEVEFIKLLFFGNRYSQMTDFVVRDVGNVKIQPLDERFFKPWFQNREEALGVLHISQLRRLIRELKAEELPLEDYLHDIPWENWLQYPKSAKSAEKLLNETAYYFEQQMLLEHALELYNLFEKPPSKERRVRILEKIDRKEEAIELAKKIISNPGNATEFTFANDYLRKSGVRIKRSMTERLKDSPQISIERPVNQNVESAALDYFVANGWQGMHSENFIWRGLFGLIFWEEIFDPSYGSFHHPLQRQPSDMSNESFFENRAEAFQDRLDNIRSKKSMTNHIEEKATEKEGIANRFVYWHESLLPTLKTMIKKLPLKGLKSVLLEIAKNPTENSRGFPDLFIWNSKSYQFYEIKSPNDHLSAQQLYWLNFLETESIKIDVLRIAYEESGTIN